MVDGAAATSDGASRVGHEEHGFALYYDAALTDPAPYSARSDYFRKARDRMDRTFERIRRYVSGQTVLDVGASPFYLLFRAKQAGAERCHGIYFANDDHPMKALSVIYSSAGPIEISHANAEVDGFPFGDDTVDVLTACEILEHFDEFPVHFAREVRRVLRPGAHLCITVPNVASIANIIKLVFRKNIYMKYRSDVTGRHKHEYTVSQLKAFVRYLGMEIVDVGYMPSPTSDLYKLRPAYRAIARTPFLKGYSPVLYIVARQPETKPTNDLSILPETLFDAAQSIEE